MIFFVTLLLLWALGWCMMHPLVVGKTGGVFIGYMLVGVMTIGLLGYLVMAALS